MKSIAALLIFLLLPLSVSAGTLPKRTGLFAVRQDGPPVVLTADEARRITITLSNARQLAEENGVLKDEVRTERAAKVAAMDAAANYKEAHELSKKRAELEAERADLEKQRAENEKALKDQARDELAKERRKNRWTKIAIGALVVGAIVLGIKNGNN